MSLDAFLAFSHPRGLHGAQAGYLYERGGFPFAARVLDLPERYHLATEEERHRPVGGHARLVAEGGHPTQVVAGRATANTRAAPVAPPSAAPSISQATTSGMAQKSCG